MRIYREIFGEHCPICWSGMERVGRDGVRSLYRCPHCGMITTGKRGTKNGSDGKLPADKYKA